MVERSPSENASQIESFREGDRSLKVLKWKGKGTMETSVNLAFPRPADKLLQERRGGVPGRGRSKKMKSRKFCHPYHRRKEESQPK